MTVPNSVVCPLCGHQLKTDRGMRYHIQFVHERAAAKLRVEKAISEEAFYTANGDYEDDPVATAYCKRNEGQRWRGRTEVRMSAASPLANAAR